MIRTVSELYRLPSFEQRFQYLKIPGIVGQETFGFDRYLNQVFYRSDAWKRVRRQVVLRDDGCEMGLSGYPIGGKVMVHHMNPITEEQIIEGDEAILDPEFLISVSYDLHQAIHFGSNIAPRKDPIVRRPNDTCPWKK